jgi:hypothetical protein
MTPTKRPIRWVPEYHPRGKLCNYSPPLSDEVKNEWTYTVNPCVVWQTQKKSTLLTKVRTWCLLCLSSFVCLRQHYIVHRYCFCLRTFLKPRNNPGNASKRIFINYGIFISTKPRGRDSVFGVPTCYILGNRFIGLIKTGPKLHPLSCTMGCEFRCWG